MDTRRYLLLQASRLFLQKSYKEVTMKDLVESTGLSKGAFYHYFETKEQLFLEVLRYVFGEVLVHSYDTFSRESFYAFYHDYIDELGTLSDRYMKLFGAGEDDDGVNINYFTLAFDALKLFPEFREEMLRGQQEELRVWTGVIREARQTGEISSVLTDYDIARLFFFTNDGMALHQMMRKAGIHEMAAQFMALWDNLYETLKA